VDIPEQIPADPETLLLPSAILEKNPSTQIMTLSSTQLKALAEIPILDLRGPEFLLFYGGFLVVACAWSVVRSRQAMRNFAIPNPPGLLTDPYDVAVLSAGPGRACQLAVVSLITKNLVDWKSKLLGARLVSVSNEIPPGLPAVELDLLQRVRSTGTRGMPVKEVNRALAMSVKPIETRLATHGLRPTYEERKSACFSSILPLVFLGGIGVIKLLVGLSRGKPVIFLVILLVITFIAAKVISPKVKRLTADGESLLEKLRLKHETARRAVSTAEADTPEMLFTGVALLGASSLMSSADFAEIHKDLHKTFDQPVVSGTSDGGCSSGFGDSGGGGGCGGGCGGCGGGGGD